MIDSDNHKSDYDLLRFVIGRIYWDITTLVFCAPKYADEVRRMDFWATAGRSIRKVSAEDSCGY